MRAPDRRRRAFAIALVLSILVSVMLPGVALGTHTAPCSPANYDENFFAGQIKSVTGLTGTRGTIEGQSLSLCTAPLNPDSGSQTWVAVTGPSGYPLSIVQIGVIRCLNPANGLVCDGTMRYFWTWGRDQTAPGCNSYLNRDPIAMSLGSASGTFDYIVAKTTTQYRVYRAGVLEASVPNSEICWTPSRAMWMGEAFNHGDQIGGQAGNKQYVSGARYQTSVGGVWQNPNFGGSVCSISMNPFFCEIATTDQVNLWTVH